LSKAQDGRARQRPAGRAEFRKGRGEKKEAPTMEPFENGLPANKLAALHVAPGTRQRAARLLAWLAEFVPG